MTAPPDPALQPEQQWAVVFTAPASAGGHSQAIEVAKRLEELDLDVRMVRERAQDESADVAAEELIHVVVPPEQADQANVEVGLHVAVTQSQAEAAPSHLFEVLGIDGDDLSIAEVAATGGPVYDLDDFDDLEDVRGLLRAFDSSGVRWALDRQGNLLVHYNDEAKADSIIDTMFGDAPDGAIDIGAPQGHDGVLDAEVYDVPGAPVVVDPGVPDPPVTTRRPVGSVADFDGRAAVDDLTGSAPVIETKGTPWWAAAVVAVVLLALFIVFVV